MGSKTPKETAQTTTVEPPAWAVPYYRNLLSASSQLAFRPYEPFEGQRIAGFTPDQLRAQQMTRDAARGQQAASETALNQLVSTLRGGGGASIGTNPYIGTRTDVGANPFAGPNPFLEQMIRDAQGDISRGFENTAAGISAQFASGGAFGGSAHAQAVADANRELAERLARTSTEMRFGDYQTQQQLAEADIARRLAASQFDTQLSAGLTESQLGRELSAWDAERGRQMQALGLLPSTFQAGLIPGQALSGIGAQQQALNQAQLDQQYADFLEQRDWRANQLGFLGNALNAITGGFQNQSATATNPNYVSPGASAASGALGGALTGASIGSVIPVIGTGIGALGGAVLGGLGGYFSDERLKDKKGPVDDEDALKAITSLPVERWNYKGDDTEHVGTMAQDFNRNLGLPGRPMISTIDYLGALTGAVKALDKRTKRRAA